MILHACRTCARPAAGRYCPVHAPPKRTTAAARGYDARWRRTRDRFLRGNPTCIDCAAAATVADHDPDSRRDLIAAGVPDPDAWHRLKPRCHRCHSRRTAIAEPGGWNRPAQPRDSDPHPTSTTRLAA